MLLSSWWDPHEDLDVNCNSMTEPLGQEREREREKKNRDRGDLQRNTLASELEKIWYSRNISKT